MATPITKRELAGQIRYGYWYNRYHARFYSRLGKAIRFVQLLFSTSVVASTLKDNSEWAIGSAIVIAALGVLSEVINFPEKAAQHKLGAAQYNDLDNALDGIDEVTAKDRITRLQNKWPDGFDAIDVLAHNTVCDLHQDPNNRVPLGLKERLFQLIL